jgi:hypothetical protein
MDQLLLMLNAGLGPTDAMGIIDNLAKLAPKNRRGCGYHKSAGQATEGGGMGNRIGRSVASQNSNGREKKFVAIDRRRDQRDRELPFLARYYELF